MSIEEKLKTEYARKSRAINGASEMNPKVMASFRKNSVAGRTRSYRKQTKTTRWTIGVVLAVIVLSGFAYGSSKLLADDKFGRWSFQLRTASEDMTLDKAVLNEISTKREEIRSHLEPGESAYLYVSALAESSHSLYRSMPMIGVFQPILIDEFEGAEQLLTQSGIGVIIPMELPNQFRFKHAYQGEADISFSFTKDAPQIQQVLKKESKDTGKGITWMKIEDERKLLNKVTLIYSNAVGEQLSIMVEVISSDEHNMNLIAPKSVQYEELKVKGLNAHYTSSDSVPFSKSHFYQNVMWTETAGNSQYVINIGTESSNVPKGILVRAAEQLK
ncbi:hypothetical protein I6N90_18110 [Paenibacillus sp. GSMTC-2017]|uniref:hypothetical protein n=1 Tax=Paenibacillus sp. GSMTC-2017 TaxID=2794350 RepID=UPI0018D5DF69|nr:hypothetical protein [Paenibacillus sp. GSMTC-2017]MBH5319715.1 hypothetical protein [Paenibacillus sp. GSMTC-2017]